MPGRVSKEEYEGRRPFESFDKDGDGFITREEAEEVFGDKSEKSGGGKRREASKDAVDETVGETGTALASSIPLDKIDPDVVCGIGRSRKCDIKLAIARGLFETGLRPKFPDGASCFGIDEGYAISYSAKRDRENYHGGIDMPARFGVPMLAAADGMVVAISDAPKSYRGKEITIRHSPENTGIPLWIYTQYAHFDELPALKVGERVKMGQPLGPTGNSGYQRPGKKPGKERRPAIHFAVWYSDKPDFAMDRYVVIPNDGWWMDPNALYRLKPPFDSKTMKALPDAEKDVPIPVLVEGGGTVPANTKLIWPYACSK
ncbi:MAG: peptidoglycan DD-metalloendopeptidase family protein [Proteobacteria bacterium]|nr:peptidoglycan DD-metalloendopeptidase family protein [Pseudomonadota bacterium]